MEILGLLLLCLRFTIDYNLVIIPSIALGYGSIKGLNYIIKGHKNDLVSLGHKIWRQIGLRTHISPLYTNSAYNAQTGHNLRIFKPHQNSEIKFTKFTEVLYCLGNSPKFSQNLSVSLTPHEKYPNPDYSEKRPAVVPRK